MSTQLRCELRKLTTTKLWWVLLLVMTVCSAAFTALIVVGALSAPRSPLHFTSPDSVVPAYNLTAAIGYVFPLAIGVVMVTQEYNSRTITTTLLSEPRRARVYCGKLLVGFGMACVYATVSVGGCALVAATILSGHGKHPYLSHSSVLSALVGSILVLSLWGAIGVGVGALVRNQAVAIVGILLMTQFLEPMVRVMCGAVNNPGVGNLLPGGAGDIASGGTIMTAATGAADTGQGAGFLVLGLYAVAFAVLGGLRFARYEVS